MQRIILIIILISYNIDGDTISLHNYVDEIIECTEEELNEQESLAPLVFNKIRFGLDNKRDISTFIRYIKTQSEQLNTTKGLIDVYFVMQTIFNRMEHNKCTWRQYYSNNNINNSKSIRMMKSGHLRTSFNIDRYHDRCLYIMSYMANTGRLHTDYKLPKNVLYFRSGKNFKDRSPHLKKNLYAIYRHHFYTN